MTRDRFRVVIRADTIHGAALACAARGLTLERPRKHPSFPEVTGLVNARADALMEWFAVDDESPGPFPLGSLLFFNQAAKETPLFAA